MINPTKGRNFSKLSIVAFSFLAPFFNTMTVVAQKTDFTGTWVLTDHQSISGKLYSNGVPKQIKATKNADTLIVEKTSATSGKDIVTTEMLYFNGTPFEVVSAFKRRKTIAIAWNREQKTFTETINTYSPEDNNKIEHKDTDVWSLEDGNLIIVRKDENFVNGEVWEEKAIYEKL